MPPYQGDAPTPWNVIQKRHNLPIWYVRPTSVVAKPAGSGQQRFVSTSYSILIYKGITGKLRRLLLGNNVVRGASRG